MKKIFVLFLTLVMCSPAYAVIKQGKVTKGVDVAPVREQEMTLGLVQKEIKIGASQDEVALALGSPNIVTKDAEGKDTWIYDKVSSIVSYNTNGFGIGAAPVGGGVVGNGIIGGILGIGYNKNKGNVQTVQKTLTVVIKFDKRYCVESFTYHMSKF